MIWNSSFWKKIYAISIALLLNCYQRMCGLQKRPVLKQDIPRVFQWSSSSSWNLEGARWFMFVIDCFKAMLYNSIGHDGSIKELLFSILVDGDFSIVEDLLIMLLLVWWSILVSCVMMLMHSSRMTSLFSSSRIMVLSGFLKTWWATYRNIRVTGHWKWLVTGTPARALCVYAPRGFKLFP